MTIIYNIMNINNLKFTIAEMLKKAQIISFLTIVMLLFSNAGLNAQENKTSIKLIARALPDSILLRWSPDNFEGWNAGNKYGYQIVRFTIMKNGELITGAKPEPLTAIPIKPWPLSQWEKLADVDGYAGVAAQAIYGETFELTANQATNFYDVVTKVKEQDSRFSFAVFAADQSSATAKASGLWFTDKNVKKGDKYLYRIYLLAPQNIVVSDTGYAYTGVDEYMPLPKPINFIGEFGDKSVLLHWDRKTLEYLYNSYDIERSEDVINFKKINKQPLVYARSEDFEEAEEMLYIDSLQANDKEYFYRVKGHTSFGETSPASEMVKGKGIVEIKAIPEIKSKKEINGQFLITWQYPEEQNKNIACFKILRSSDYLAGYDTISGLITPEKREFLDFKPLSTNYYKVLVQGKNGTKRNSLAILAQLADSIPPASPIGLKAVADTTGKLILSWKRNTEEDMYGYRVYRANASNEEFSQITVAPVKDTAFVDKINVMTLTKKIYYRLMAIDKRQNHSVFSEALEVERPDVVPPASPAIVSVKSTPNGAYIQWENSSSEDVAEHIVCRRAKWQAVIDPIKEIPITDTTRNYLDTTIIENTVYYYTLVAQDKSGLKSKPTPEMAAEKLPSDRLTGMGKLKYEIDRKVKTVTISWNKPESKVVRYIIYRKTGEEGKLVIYANAPGDKNVFVDKRLTEDTKYTYTIKCILENGSTYIFNDLITVLY